MKTKNIPIIMLTVESTEHDKVMGLGVGADDYITKPFSNQELIARVRAILRRTVRKEEKQVLKLNGLIMDLEARRVTVSGKEIMLRPKEFDLLQMFLSKQDMVISKELILEKLELAKKDYEQMMNALMNKEGNSADDTSHTYKVMEDGYATQSKEELSLLAYRQQKFMKGLQAALLRIDNKTYGICRETGKLIPKERLRAVPHATLSIEAKEKRGKK